MGLSTDWGVEINRWGVWRARRNFNLTQRAMGRLFELTTLPWPPEAPAPHVKKKRSLDMRQDGRRVMRATTTSFIIYTKKPEIPVGKFNDLRHSIWEASEIMSGWLRWCILKITFIVSWLGFTFFFFSHKFNVIILCLWMKVPFGQFVHMISSQPYLSFSLLKRTTTNNLKKVKT